MSDFELKRKTVHFAGVLAVPLSGAIGTFNTAMLSLAFSLALFLHSIYLEHKHRLREKNPLRVKLFEDLEDAWHGLIDSLERKEHQGHYHGAIFYGLGIGGSLLLMPEKIAFLSIIALTVGDTFSTIVGHYIGKRKLPWSERKSFEGFFAGMASTSAAGLLVVSPHTAILTGLVGAVAETLPVKVNDNLLIPLSVWIILSVVGA